ncbi:MAG: hypothetical protein KM312_00295 [Hydrogenibacillus schlegelii]|uniref:Uncharacterized protein n=1 Tax=Hydrogenibacillus schlegelii TaxID=1484 RepID=A0A947G8X7_HYDSH|nr:hypothetical protein [Hydrogenibacillus schlegelii]
MRRIKVASTRPGQYTPYVTFALSVLAVWFGIQPVLKYGLTALSERVPGIKGAVGFLGLLWEPSDFRTAALLLGEFVLLYFFLLSHIRFAWIWGHLYILSSATSLFIVATFQYIIPAVKRSGTMYPDAAALYLIIAVLIFRAWYVHRFLRPRQTELRLLRGAKTWPTRK